MPDLTDKPEKASLILQAWKKLPNDRKAMLRYIMRRPCAWCQGEFDLPVIGSSHGICRRHEEKTWREMGMEPPVRDASHESPVDLATLSSQERSILKYMYAIIYRKGKEKKAKSSQVS